MRKRRLYPKAHCDVCGGVYIKTRKWKRFCSMKCRNMWHWNERREAIVYYHETVCKDRVSDQVRDDKVAEWLSRGREHELEVGGLAAGGGDGGVDGAGDSAGTSSEEVGREEVGSEGECGTEVIPEEEEETTWTQRD